MGRILLKNGVVIIYRNGWVKKSRDAHLSYLIVLGGKTYTSVRSVSATYVFNENYYVSRYRYLGGAMALIMLAILSVMPT